MVVQRVLVLLVCWAALLATCLPQGVFLGHLTSKGKVIGNVYAVNRTTLRIESSNLSGTDGDIVFTFVHAPKPYVASKKTAVRILTPSSDKTATVSPTRRLSHDRIPAGINAPHKESPGLNLLSFIITPRQSSEQLGGLVVNPVSCVPAITDFIPDGTKTVLTMLVAARSTVSTTCSGVIISSTTSLSLPTPTTGTMSLSPTATSTTSLSPTATSTTGTTSLSPTATSTAGAMSLSSTATSTAGAMSPSPTATSTADATSLSPTVPTSVGAMSLSPTATSTAGGTSLSPTTTTTTSPSPTATSLPMLNCASLTSDYGVCWERKGRSGKFILCAKGIGSGQYMAFGWSRNVKKTTMVEADAVVCSHHINGTWDVEDYYLESRQLCGTDQEGQTVGVCPDTAFGGASNIVITSGFYENSVGYCEFKRKLHSSKKHDMKVKLKKKKQAIVWATGPVGADGRIQKHSRRADDNQFFSFVDGGQPCKLGDHKLCCNNIIQQ